MASKKTSPKDMLPLCGAPSPEDGTDPRESSLEKSAPRKGDRKVRQLCSQVAETLGLVLSGECGDEVLPESSGSWRSNPRRMASHFHHVCGIAWRDNRCENDVMETLNANHGQAAFAKIAGGAAITRTAPKARIFELL